MLLATPGQTASYVCHAPASANASGNSTSIGSNHIQSKALGSAHKLGRTTYKLIESSQNNTPTGSSTTTQATVLMKTIAARANRSSGFHSATQSAPGNSVKSNSSVTLNDNVVRKAIANATNNGNASKSTTKATSSALSSSSIANNTKSSAAAANAATTPSTTSSSSSSSLSTAKIVLTASFLKTYTVPPTDLHRSSAARSRSYSTDSLYDEMCHFKPIRTVPTTPWKCGSRSRGATIKAPKARLGQKTSNCDVDSKTKRIRKNLKRECSKPKTKIKPKLSANLFPHLRPHPSAFVRLLLPMCSYTIPSSTHRIRKRLQSSKTAENNSKPAKKTAKNTTKQPNKVQPKMEKIKKATVKSKLSNTKKRKAQTQPKKHESIASKKSKVDTVNRKTPPLTRRRIRLDENCKLYGPLA